MTVALVTGATGLLGRSLTRALLDRGDAVVALARRPQDAGLDRRAVAVAADVTDPEALPAVVAEHRPQTVFHLAAAATNGAATTPQHAHAVNVGGTAKVLRAALAGAVGQVFVAGSVAAYAPAAGPLDEDAPLLPVAPADPYGATKAQTDALARAFARRHGLRVAVARLSNVYGSGDRHPSRLVPELLGAVRAGRPPAIRSDGTPRLDLLHVDDAVAALVALAEAGAATTSGEAYNIAAGRSVAVREVVGTLERVVGHPLHATYGHERQSEPAAADIVITKITTATGWRPRLSLEDGLRRSLDR
jgi:nucleoside-diphosphate-sugar epimerase